MPHASGPEHLDESEEESEKVGLKLNIQKTKGSCTQVSSAGL